MTPENKGGLICAKEYENKCLAQKIEFIKELQKENAELRKKNLNTQDAVTMQMYVNKANKEIADRQLTKAKEIIHKFCYEYGIYDKDFVEETKQFLKDGCDTNRNSVYVPTRPDGTVMGYEILNIDVDSEVEK